MSVLSIYFLSYVLSRQLVELIVEPKKYFCLYEDVNKNDLISFSVTENSYKLISKIPFSKHIKAENGKDLISVSNKNDRKDMGLALNSDVAEEVQLCILNTHKKTIEVEVEIKNSGFYSYEKTGPKKSDIENVDIKITDIEGKFLRIRSMMNKLLDKMTQHNSQFDSVINWIGYLSYLSFFLLIILIIIETIVFILKNKSRKLI